MIYTKYKLKNCEYKQQMRNFAFCIDNEKFLIYAYTIPREERRRRKVRRITEMRVGWACLRIMSSLFTEKWVRVKLLT